LLGWLLQKQFLSRAISVGQLAAFHGRTIAKMNGAVAK
jgi:hypothetical protein